MKTIGVDVAPSLRALLGGSIDYAGLFPPAALALKSALDNHATYVRHHDTWLLGCFVLPLAKLAEAGPLLAGRFNAQYPLKISTLGSKARSADEFLDGLRAGLRALADFEAGHGDAVAVEQLEVPLPPDTTPGPAFASLLKETANLLSKTNELKRSPHAFWEIPFAENLPDLLQGLAAYNTMTARPFYAKLRTGGLDAAAFPSSAQLAAALVAARNAGVALKFTAGLHHPFRRFDAGVPAKMHGFVNVLAAGVLLRQPGFDATLAQAILEDENPTNFHFDTDGLRWRDHHMTTGAIAETRKFVTSFGSCSFDEPRDDLRAANLL